MNAKVEKNSTRTMLGRLLAGAVVGAGATALFLALVGEPHMDLDDPAVMLAIVTGLIYALIGLMVALGLAAPRTGARFLNVEDADELREEGPKLRVGAVVCILAGVFLLVLAMADGGALIGREAALVIAGACLALIVLLTLVSRKRYDELTRQISLESSALTLHSSLVLLGGWAALAHLGYVEWLDPLALISALALLELIAIMVVSTRKGLMRPR